MELFTVVQTTNHPKSGLSSKVLIITGNRGVAGRIYSRQCKKNFEKLTHNLVRNEISDVDIAHEFEWKNGCVKRVELLTTAWAQIDIQIGGVS